jgi:rubrerythrin
MSAGTTLPPRELATVIAALRLWQQRNEVDGLHPRRLLDLEQVIATEHGPALTSGEIDELCEKLNPAQELPRFRNHYRCVCGETWSNEDDCTCNDRCPICHAETEPFESEDL